ncbi:hypothetical protein WMZ97_18220 [Lentibacillus sp. N15]|uniref:hypothetical protein n=1 Tax=Lentibacillus songyuanensis TaxID=3136161 RepID=UPI0031BA6400
MRVDNKLTYYNIYDLFISAEKNYLMLGWYLLIRTRTFNLHAPAQRSYLRWVPGKIIKVYRVIRIIYRLFILKNIYRNNRNNRNQFIQVPFEGHITLETCNGYKVFDLQKRVVVTQYELGYKEEMFNQVARGFKAVSEYGVSASLKWIDYKNKCIYEEYLNLYRADPFFPFSTYFYNHILPVWERNLTLFPMKKVDARTYILQQRSFITNSIEQLKSKGYDQDKLVYIDNFANKLTERLLTREGQESIYLSLTHGDMHFKNILLGKKYGLMIDCNTFEERSIFHDLCFMFFYHLIKKPSIDSIDLINKLEGYAKWSIVKNDWGEYCPTFAAVKFYRQLFYLEHIVTAFEFNINIYVEEHTQGESELSYWNHVIKVIDNADRKQILIDLKNDKVAN